MSGTWMTLKITVIHYLHNQQILHPLPKVQSLLRGMHMQAMGSAFLQENHAQVVWTLYMLLHGEIYKKRKKTEQFIL